MILSPATQTIVDFQGRLSAYGESARYWRLNAYEALWKGARYDGRPSFWDDTVPLAERAPLVQAGIVETAIKRLASLVFGNARFPTLAVGESDYGQDFSDQDQEALAKLVARLVTVAGLRMVMREALRQGLGIGTVCLLLSLRRGRPEVSVKSAKYCTPKYEDDTLVELEISYLTDLNGKTVRYRRLITATEDLTFYELPPEQVGRAPWVADPKRSVTHNLGFCPVIWHAHQPDPSDHDEIDGTPLFAGAEAEVEALDFALSQHHRTGRYNGDPQIIRTGVDGTKPADADGRTSMVGGMVKWLSNPQNNPNQLTKPALRKAPGRVWNMPEGSDAKLLESTGSGAEILRHDVDGLRRALCEAKGIVLASPEQVSANASAALLETLFEPMVAEADGLREEYGDLLCEVVNGLLRVVASDAARTGGVWVSGYREALPALSRLSVDTTEGSVWVGAPLIPAWGEYFEPRWTEIQTAVQTAQAANGGKPVLTHKQSIQLVAPLLSATESVEETLRELTASNPVQIEPPRPNNNLVERP